MRRRERDVFELGEEQLLDEPAVELAESQDPPVPPPADGSATEAEGPEESRVHGTHAARVLPRVPSLGGLLSRRPVAATALSSLVLGVAALIGTRQALEREGDVAPVAAPQGRGTGAAQADRARRRRAVDRVRASGRREDAGPDNPGSAATATPVQGVTAKASADAPDAQPGYVDAAAAGEAGVPPSEPAPSASPEVVAREFGL